jgi:hypothetical protein
VLIVVVEVTLSCQNHLVEVAVRSRLPVVWAVEKSRVPLYPSEQHAELPLVPMGYAPLSLVLMAGAAQSAFAPMAAPAHLWQVDCACPSSFEPTVDAVLFLAWVR